MGGARVRSTAARRGRELYSGLIRMHVLHHACEEPIFGLGMIEELARHGYHLSPGTMYPLLRQLERGGLLRSERQLVSGRVRCVYRATPAGRRALEVAKLRVRELFGELFENETTSAGAIGSLDLHRDGAARSGRPSFSDR
jgi:PadR family transcriptional regulator, regulatory protein PadR